MFFIEMTEATTIQALVWLALSVLFLISELGAPGLFVFLSFSLGSMSSFYLAYQGYGLTLQLLFFIVISLSVLVVMRRWIKARTPHIRHVSGVQALIGKEAIVVRQVSHYQPGLVKIGGEVWTAITVGEKIKKPEEVVRVVGVEGNKVIVQ